MQGLRSPGPRGEWSATRGLDIPRTICRLLHALAAGHGFFRYFSRALRLLNFGFPHAPYIGSVAEESRARAVLSQGAIGRHT